MGALQFAAFPKSYISKGMTEFLKNDLWTKCFAFVLVQILMYKIEFFFQKVSTTN